jgi:hypothetical protein
MLLVHRSRYASLLRFVLSSTVVPLVLSAVSCAQHTGSCAVTFELYDARGNAQSFEILAVKPTSEPEDQRFARDIDLLKPNITGYRFVAKGNRLQFPREFLAQRPVEITFHVEKSNKLKQQIFLHSCNQRATVVGGEQYANGTAAWSHVSGKIVGCREALWIRATPMFGDPASSFAFDGHVNANGEFSVAVNRGVRHLLIVGTGKQPLKAVAIDVVNGGRNLVGEVDVGSCANPK